MHIIRKLLATGGVLAGASLLAQPALSQDDDAARTLPETVVSAGRLPIDARKVGSSVTIVDQEDIVDRQDQVLADVLRDVPGVSVNRSGSLGTFTQIRIRGAEANHILVLIDGMEATDPALGNEFDFANLLAFGISRVEVLRGPQSGIYGADALAGVIAIETADGKPGVHLDTISEFGSFGTYLNGGRLSGAYQGLNVSFFGVRMDAAGSNVTRSDAPGFVNEQDGYGNSTLHGKVSWRPRDFLELKFVGRYVDRTSETDSADFTTGRATDTDDETKNVIGQFRTSATIFLLDDRWETTFALSYFNARSEFRSDGVQTGRQRGQRLKLTAQTAYRFTTPTLFDAAHQLIFAVEHERQNFENRGDVTIFGDPNQNRRRLQNGWVGEYRLSLLDRLFVTGAVRYDQNDEFKNELTWRGTLAYLIPTWGTKLHTSGGRGVKNPSFFELFGFSTGGLFPFVGNPDLTPESSIGWDIGVEQSLFNKRLVVDLTFFQSWLDDEIVSVTGPIPGSNSVANLAGTSRRHGLELSVSAEIFEGLTVKAAYTYLIAQEPTGTDEVRRPRHSGAVHINYRFLQDKANVNLGFRFNGSMDDTNFATGDRVRLAGYTLVTLAGSYKVHKYVTLFARVENILNQRQQEVFGLQGPGIGAYGGIKLNLALFE